MNYEIKVFLAYADMQQALIKLATEKIDVGLPFNKMDAKLEFVPGEFNGATVTLRINGPE